jgi:hypothetical protein
VLTDKVQSNEKALHALGVSVLVWNGNGKRTRQRAVGEDRADAALQLRNQQARGSTEFRLPALRTATGKSRDARAVDDYLEECKLNRSPKTHLAYSVRFGMPVGARAVASS